MAKQKNQTKQNKKTPSKKSTNVLAGRIQNVAWFYTLVFFALFPLLYDMNKYLAITKGKYNYFVFLTLSFAFVLAFLYFATMLTGSIKFTSPLPLAKKASFMQIAMAAYILTAIISALLSEYSESVWIGSSRFDGLFTILLYALLFYLVSFFERPSEWFIIGIGGSLTIFALIGLLQLWNIDVLALYPSGQSFLNLPFVSTIGNIDIVATYLCIVLPILCVAMITSDQWWRYLLLIPIAMGLYLEVLIDVDAGKVGLLTCALVLIPMLFRNKKQIMDGLLVLATIAFTVALGYATDITRTELWSGNIGVETAFNFGGMHKLLMGAAVLFLLMYAALRLYKGEFKVNPKLLTAALAALIVLALIVGAVYIYNNSEDASNRLLYEIGQIMRGNLQDEFGTYRMLVWKRALPMALNGPLFGTGPDTFLPVFTEAFGDDVKAAGLNVVFDFAHNDFIQIMCNLGSIGLIAYLAVLIGAAIGFFRYGCKDRWTLIFGAAVIGYCAQSFFSFTIIITAPLFYVALGLLDGCHRRNRELNKQEAN